MENVRVTSKKEEILKIFEDAITQKTEVILWQTVRNERKMMLAEFKFIDKDEGTLLLKSLSNTAFTFDEESSLQVKSEYRSIKFKGRIKLSKDSLLMIQIPDEVQVHDFREKQRKNVTLLGEHKLTLEKVFKKDAKGVGESEELDLTILDITRDGASVAVEEDRIKDFEEGESLTIVALSSIFLPHAIEGEVVYLVPLKRVANDVSASPSAYRMGIKFKQKLTEALLAILQKS